MNKTIPCECKTLQLSHYTLLYFTAANAFATHNRAGEISYEFMSANTIRASIITYTTASAGQASRDSLPIRWGDGSPDEMLHRVNGSGQSIGNGINKNIYTGIHNYTNATTGSFYVISMSDPNRNSDISNMATSINVPFYIEDTVWFQGQGLDHSPVFQNPLTSFISSSDTIFYDPHAWDADGDSMVFSLVVPMQGSGTPVPAYYYPDAYPQVPGDTLFIDHHTGLVTWASPQLSGFYDIAILTEEYRNGALIGSALRDLLIQVNAANINAGLSEAPNSHTFVKIYPNPSQDILHISSASSIHSIDIYSADGRLMRQVTGIDKAVFDITTYDLAYGQYVLVLHSDKEGASSSRFDILR